MKFLNLVLFTILFYSKLQAKVFVYCSEASPSSFGPALNTSGTSADASTHPVYNRLVEFKPGSTEIKPSLATDWSISKDGLQYTFNLRKGVKFHKTKFFGPTRDFNADDVMFSFNRQFDSKHDFHKVGGGRFEMWNAMDMGKIISKIEKLGSHQVRFTLSTPNAPFLANLAMGFSSIYSAEYALNLKKQSKDEDLDYYPVGTGPFIFKSYVKDTIIRFKRNADYFAGKPEISKLIFAITPDPSVRYQKLKAGECHLINEPAPTDISEIKNNPSLKVLESEGLNVGYLGLNVEASPLNNVNVRKAINHALNRSSYIKAIYKGLASVAKNPIPPSMWSYNDQVNDFAYDVNLAKSFIVKAKKELGIDKIELNLWTLPVSRPYNPNGKKMGEIMQSDLKKIGINVKLISYDWPTYLAKLRKGEHQLIQLGWTGDNGDPDNFLGVLLSCAGKKSGSNVARWCHDKFESLIQNARKTTDMKKREKYYKEAQIIFKKEAPWVTLAHAKVFKAMTKNVNGFVVDPLGRNMFEHVDLK